MLVRERGNILAHLAEIALAHRVLHLQLLLVGLWDNQKQKLNFSLIWKFHAERRLIGFQISLEYIDGGRQITQVLALAACEHFVHFI